MSSLGAPRFREPEIAGAALQMHRLSRRASPPNTIRPRDHQTCINVAKTLLTTILVEPRARRSPKPHLRNRERTFHVSPLPRTTTSRRLERRRPLVGSTPSRRPQRDAPALGLARVARPRPRARRRLAPRDAMDHSRRTRLVAAASAAVFSQQRPTAPRRRARELPNASSAFTATTGRVRGCFPTA